MAQKYVMWGDVNNVPFMTLNKGKFECILKNISLGRFLQYTFKYNTNLTSVSFPKLTTISGEYAMFDAFSSCTNLTSVSFPELTTISGAYALGRAFQNCANLTSVSFPKLTTVTYPNVTFYEAGPSTLTIHLPKALSSLNITNNDGSTSSNYCSFVYDL